MGESWRGTVWVYVPDNPFICSQKYFLSQEIKRGHPDEGSEPGEFFRSAVPAQLGATSRAVRATHTPKTPI